MFRTIVPTVVLWALVLAAGAFALQWLEYQYLARRFSWEIYVAVIGTAFAGGGVWVGWKRSRPSNAAPTPPLPTLSPQGGEDFWRYFGLRNL